MFKAVSLYARELRDHLRLRFDETRATQGLVFYAEKASDYRYFRAYIAHIFAHSDLEIAYLTSDPADPLLDDPRPRLKTFYVNHLLRMTISTLDAAVLAMTMPDLGSFYVLRSSHPVNHVYMFHGLGSVHSQYNAGAFDHYDTIFCLGPTDDRELKKWEEQYGTKPKVNVACGYPLIEEIYKEHQDRSSQVRDRPLVLIAPSWHPDNILEFCFDELVDSLAGSEFDVVVRPHPEYLRRSTKRVQQIARRLQDVENVSLELDMLSGASVHDADILVTDWSGISFEYAFGTERPVLFIETPSKIQNPDYEQLGLEPIEFSTRDELGVRVDKAEVPQIRATLRDTLNRREHYRSRIVACRARTLYNWMSAAQVGGDFLIERCVARKNAAAAASEASR